MIFGGSTVGEGVVKGIQLVCLQPHRLILHPGNLTQDSNISVRGYQVIPLTNGIREETQAGTETKHKTKEEDLNPESWHF